MWEKDHLHRSAATHPGSARYMRSQSNYADPISLCRILSLAIPDIFWIIPRWQAFAVDHAEWSVDPAARKKWRGLTAPRGGLPNNSPAHAVLAALEYCSIRLADAWRISQRTAVSRKSRGNGFRT